MPVSISITDNGRGVVLVASGALSKYETIEANKAFFAEHTQDFALCRYWLADYHQVVSSEIRSDQLRQLSVMHIAASKINPNLSVAFYTPHTWQIGTARLWETLAEETGWNIRIFKTEDAAKQWLGEILGEELTFT